LLGRAISFFITNSDCLNSQINVVHRSTDSLIVNNDKCRQIGVGSVKLTLFQLKVGRLPASGSYSGYISPMYFLPSTHHKTVFLRQGLEICLGWSSEWTSATIHEVSSRAEKCAQKQLLSEVKTLDHSIWSGEPALNNSLFPPLFKIICCGAMFP
jgi:hypothetical protein